MKGFYVSRRAGWDTHGLPVELEVEKELHLSSKDQIENFGVDKFNARCRESVFRYLKDWKELTARIGFWIDIDNPYITLDNNYIETCWWILKNFWDKGLIYKGHRVTPHCPRCGTSLSSHEVSLGYKDDTPDPSVYVKFKIKDFSPDTSPALRKLLSSQEPAYLLAWTTTPWTLPGNVALAVSPSTNYAVVEISGEFKKMRDAIRGELQNICSSARWRVRVFSNPFYGKKGEEVPDQRAVSINLEAREPLFRPDGQPVTERPKDGAGKKIMDVIPEPIKPKYQLKIEADTIQLVPV